MATRSALNVIVPGKLYQRGQILSWQQDVKKQMMGERGISVVVNFWPKLDCDLYDLPVEVYLHIPAFRSHKMLESHIQTSAKYVADLIRNDNKGVLVLCEAGVTRSVYFCILVVSELHGIPIKEAYDYVKSKLPKISMKEFMMKKILA